ncbi:MAG: guanosine-5'-triphosphate,3'-diphosphate diphosphatase [Succinivibrionaceae bacterium]|nr:guanosine-5'-triphosphate,3'-diphosphate diphosphatase [Succinivibrionaceae bacterium]
MAEDETSRQSPLFASIDLGSNSFHMLVVRQVHGAIRVVSKVKRKIRLASGLDASNTLSREAMERGWDCLRLFSEQLQDIPSENIRIVGTATLRLATNSSTFVRIAEEILGHKVEVISGLEEAQTIYQGVSWTSSGSGNRLVLDIGGASTEVILGEGVDVKLMNSMPLGCVTWLNRFFADRLLTESAFDEAVAEAGRIFSGIAGEYIKIGWGMCVGASGTVQALQEIIIAQGKSETVTLDKLYELKARAISCGSLDSLVIDGLEADRLAVFPSGLAILIALFETFRIRELVMAGGALREGLVYSMIAASNQLTGGAFGDAQLRTVESMISRYQLDPEQGRRVEAVCMKIYEQLRAYWQLDDQYGRMILSRAAVLYELGLCIEYKRAPQHAAYIVENIDMPGFTLAQKLLLSALLSNQRDEIRLEPLRRQHAVPFEEACHLVRILRFAIIMCIRRTEGTIPKFTFTVQDGALKLVLPEGWLASHYLRGAELENEVKLQTRFGWPSEIMELKHYDARMELLPFQNSARIRQASEKNPDSAAREKGGEQDGGRMYPDF